MATITSLGVGSGLDLDTMVSKLVAVEKEPLEQMQTDASKISAQISSYGKITSLFSSLQTAANKLTGTSLWKQASSTSSNAAAVSVSGSSSAATGSYSVAVSQLASGQTMASTATVSAATDLVGAGTLTLEMGSWSSDGTSFDASPTYTPVTLAVTAADTLQTLRDKINALGADVTASIISDANGTRLSLRSTGTGADSGFRISAADSDGSTSDGAGLSRFANSSSGGMSITQVAKNAKATVNNIAVESQSNDITGVIDGLTLRLHQVTTANVEIDVSPDSDAVTSAIQDFAAAYNSLASLIASQTAYNATTKVAGTLQGDSAITGLQRQMRSLLNTSSTASSTYGRLSDIGLEMQRDGTLKVNSTKLAAAVDNPAELQRALAANDTSTANTGDGLARRFAELATQVMGVDGTLTTRTGGLQTRLDRNGDDQEKLEDRVDRYKERLVAQYTAMDTKLSTLSALSTYLTQQLELLNKSSGD